LSSFFPPPKKKKEGVFEQTKRHLGLLKSTVQVGEAAISKNPEKAMQQLVVAGLKMAEEIPFYNPAVNPLKLIDGLKTLGIGALAWSPETLMAAIDRKYHNWSDDEVANALEHFHKTGTLKTDVPQLVREKIYAIRVISTSNTAQTEWHVFEKIGGAFNDRVAQFGTLEPLSAAECAKTVALIETIRPDTYENEIKIYIAASCFSDGLYTVDPVKWLAIAETYLQQMNFESTGEHVDPTIKTKILDALNTYRAYKTTVREVPDELAAVQASKLLAIEEYVDEALKEA
jgi:hypothetical protein